jgi:hypothetical protein
MTPNELKLYIYVHELVERHKKKPNKNRWPKPSHGRQKEGQRKTKRHATRMNQQRERTRPSCGRRLFHP